MSALDAEPGKCVVLGGRGFIGSHIVTHLASTGWKVRVFGRRSHDATPQTAAFDGYSNIEIIEGEFGNEVDMAQALNGCDACVHSITTTLPHSSNADIRYDVESNLLSTILLLKLLRDSTVKRTVFLSSGGTVYGKPNYIPIDENHPTNPVSSYGVTKLAIEKYLNLFSHNWGVNAVTLRVSNPFGERQRFDTQQGAIATFLNSALTGKRIPIWGDGSVVRDYVHVSDVAVAVGRALTYRGGESVFNIGSGEGTSLLELLRLIENATQNPLDVKFQPGRKLDVPVSVLDIGRAATELGWRPEVAIEEGLRRTMEWMKATLWPATADAPAKPGPVYPYPEQRSENATYISTR